MQNEKKEVVSDDDKDFNINGGSFNEADYITRLLQENERLLKENTFLKHYLVTLKNNATLKTASIITTVLSWTDDQLCQSFEDLLAKERGEMVPDYISDGKNISNQSARVYTEEMQPANQQQAAYESLHRQEFTVPSTTGRYSDESAKQRIVNEPQRMSQNQQKQFSMTDNVFRPISPSYLDQKNQASAENFPKNQSQDQQHYQRISPTVVTSNQYADRTDSILTPNSRRQMVSATVLKPQSRSQTVSPNLRQFSPTNKGPASYKPQSRWQMVSPNISPTTILPSKHQASVQMTDKPFEGYEEPASFNNLPTKVINENYNPTQERVSPQNSGSKNNVEEPTDWNSLVYRPPEVIKASSGQVTDQQSFGPKVSGSEGYGSQVEAEPNYSIQSDGRDRLGDPIGSSTPRKGGSNYTQDNTLREMNTSRKGHSNKDPKSAVSVLHRPIDAIIGLRPIFNEHRRQKLSRILSSKRIIGEIAFQLDRRILEYVFTGKQTQGGVQERRRRFYGYNISNIGSQIRKEATDKSGQFNPKRELEMRYRFDYIIKSLIKFGYVLEKHAVLSQDLVNKFGILSGPPDRKTIQEFGLDDPVLLRVLLGRIIKDDVLLQETLVILDCLCLLSHDDKKSIFCY